MTDKTTGEMEQVDPGMSVVPEAGLEDVPTIIPELDSALAAVPSALPAYQTTAWKNKPSTATPVTAEVMTRVEQRLVDLTNAVNALRDSVSLAARREGAADAFVGANKTAGHCVDVMAQSSLGRYILFATVDSLELWDGAKNTQVWHLNTK